MLAKDGAHLVLRVYCLVWTFRKDHCAYSGKKEQFSNWLTYWLGYCPERFRLWAWEARTLFPARTGGTESRPPTISYDQRTTHFWSESFLFCVHITLYLLTEVFPYVLSNYQHTDLRGQDVPMPIRRGYWNLITFLQRSCPSWRIALVLAREIGSFLQLVTFKGQTSSPVFA